MGGPMTDTMTSFADTIDLKPSGPNLWAGTIDPDYRGEVQVLLVNHGDEPFVVRRGERIAQLVVARFERVFWVEAEDLASSTRGSGGFGSTGLQ